MKTIIISILLILSVVAQSQEAPSFGPEIDVSVNGLTFDAMEPFISSDGHTLFFNNLNDGVNTKLYYATKLNDSTFNYRGLLNGTNQTIEPHLDAVADMDSLNNFFWTSTRNYPLELENLFHGSYHEGNVTSIGRVHGDFNKNIVGWLVMDHGISLNGQHLYYNNARFNGVCQGPCETELGIAQKLNDSTFNKMPNSNSILQHINNPNYIYYAPCISSDNLELYYTQYPKDTITPNTLFEICVAVRNSTTDPFSIPTVLFSEFISNLIEAPTLTTDKQILYYHRKIPNTHKIVMRYRKNTSTTINIADIEIPISVYPNPTNGMLNIKPTLEYQKINLSVLSLNGTMLIATTNQTEIDLEAIPSGTYFLRIEIDGKTKTEKFVKLD